MRRYLLLCCLLLCLTIPLHAQDNPTPYEIALQRIQRAATSGFLGLDLSSLGLTELPMELWSLTNLQQLLLSDNELTNISPEIGQLTNLRMLYLDNNQLMSLPSEIGQLTNLGMLSLNDNQLVSLPPEIDQLTSLCILTLHNNQLKYLPSEMSNLPLLENAENCGRYLSLYDNPLISPPPEVVEQGTAAVLEYLRNQPQYHIQPLIIAGASGVGMMAMLLLGLRYRQTRRKSKAKRG